MNEYKLQTTSVWSFPNRGSWATHKGDYRGNWSPHVPRNLILKYTKEGDTVLDCFVGSGTTLIECKLLNRNAIGIDISTNALSLTKKRLDFNSPYSPNITLINSSACCMNTIPSNTIDFICTHPPYADIIKYSDSIPDDLSHIPYSEFLTKLLKVAKELYRVLKPSHFCSFMMGDIRKNGNIIPLGFLSMDVFQHAGFTLKEIIIKEQHNCSSTSFWSNRSQQNNFYLLAHEYIFILKK